MRLSLRRVIQWAFIFVLLQFVVYYWSIKRPRRGDGKAHTHQYFDSLDSDDGTCSFKTCPKIKEGMINVHLVPHSHIDVGWLKTVDQYYTGENFSNEISIACVRCTLNSTIEELLKDPRRRFIFIEMKYLSRFWHEADEVLQNNIRQLIKERRLEIVNGGWVMSDAGVTMYNDIIDQHTLGFDFIRDTFGSCAQSRTAWHVDQFGHSREHASIFAQMGYDSLFIGRVDYQDLADRKKKKNLEFVWKTSPQNLKEKSTIFVQTTFDGYYAPADFIFDNDHIMRNDPVVLKRATDHFIHLLLERAKSFRTNHLLVPMGSDFGYREASFWYLNMEALIDRINSMASSEKFNGMRLNLFYSTPSCYTYHVNKANEVFQTKSDDLFPYGIEPGVYWSGYFTTRGGFKMHIRRAGQILQSCKQLSIFVGLKDTFNQINELRDVLSVMQHHDAITGTQTLLVLQDYNLQLSKAEEQCLTVMSNAYNSLWSLEDRRYTNHPDMTANFCPDLNISSCQISENSDEFIVTIYNPLSWPVLEPVRIPIQLKNWTITNWKGQDLPAQLVPVPEGVMAIPEKPTFAEIEIVFNAPLPPMSVTSFTIKSEEGGVKPTFLENAARDIVIENQHLSLAFSATTGKLVSMHNKDSRVTETVSQDFAYYVGHQSGPRPSGAYVFVPRDKKPVVVEPNSVDIKVIKGKVVQEVHQRFSNWVSQVVRLYNGTKYAEFQWIVGPLDNDIGREVISKFTTSLNSDNSFYTDSNGREIIQRIRNTAESGNTKIKDYISGNYYPITSRIYIQDEIKRSRLTVLTDRPQGGSSLHSGDVELMVHRRLLFDDGLGVAEALKDNGVDKNGIIYTGKHYVCLDTIENSALFTKHLAVQTHLAPVLMFTPANSSNIYRAYRQHTFLAATLPDNVQILTLDRIYESINDFYLLRLEHIFEANEHSVLSQPVELSLQNLFKPFEIVSADETTLGGNFIPQDIARMEWQTVDGRTESIVGSTDYKSFIQKPYRIKLAPMEIRTFRIQVSRIH